MTPITSSAAAVLHTTAPLNAEEARALTNRIRSTAEDLAGLLHEAYERRAWEALGYASWREYATTELDISKSHAYRLLDQARVIAAVREAAGFSPNGEIAPPVEISESVAREIKPHLAAVTNEIAARIEAGEDPARAISTTVETTVETVRAARAETHASPPQADEDEEQPEGPDLVAELEAAHQEIRRLEALNESLAATDLGGEVKRWAEKYSRLEGRLQQAVAEGNTAKQQATRQGRLLKEIRSILKVERDGEITDRLRELVER